MRYLKGAEWTGMGKENEGGRGSVMRGVVDNLLLKTLGHDEGH